MDEYPSNSKKNQNDRDIDAPKKIDRIIEGEVVRRKKSLGKRFKEIFIGGESKIIRNKVWYEILVPAAKDLFVDAVREAVELRVFGEARYGSRRRTSSGRNNGSPNYVNYGGQYSQNTPRDRQHDLNEFRSVSHKTRASHHFDEIILATRAEANEVLDTLFNLIAKYEVASVTDLYTMLNITPEYTDNKWGWIDIDGADVSQVRGGYLLNLPKPQPID